MQPHRATPINITKELYITQATFVAAAMHVITSSPENK